MINSEWLAAGILLALFALFAWGRWRYDIVAMAALMAAVIGGLVPPDQAFNGFAHPAVVTVGAVLIISQAMKNAGVVDVIAVQLQHFTGNPILHITALTAVITFASAFMNNVGALALLMPIALSSARERDRSPALLLMPLAFGSLLGGMMTLIGTPPNIIIANVRADYVGEPFRMFDFTAVGLPIALAGLAFLSLIGWRLIPRERLEQVKAEEWFDVGRYLTEVRVGEKSKLIGSTLGELEQTTGGKIEVIGVAGEWRFIRSTRSSYVIGEDDVLLMSGDQGELKEFIDQQKLELLNAATPLFKNPERGNEIMVEGVVRNDSPLIGQGSNYISVHSARTLALVGLARQGQPVMQRLRQLVFRPGDVLLLFGDASSVQQQVQKLGLMPLAERPIELQHRRRVLLASGIFVCAILLGMFGLTTLPIAFILAIGAYISTGIIHPRQLYEQIDWPVIVLLAALIPVGNTLVETGLTQDVADALLSVGQGLSPVVVLTVLLIAAMLLSDVINNAATALIMGPLGIALAESMDLNPDPFLMAVAVGASCAFLTPIGHQSNTLVMGPGGYRFSDYWRVGLPLEILIVLLAVPLIVWRWGF